MNKYIYRSDAANNIKELQDMATPDWSDADHKSFQLKHHTCEEGRAQIRIEKQIIINKLLKWANKKQFTMLHFL